MKVCVLNYTGNRSNWGCQATSRHLLDLLRAAGEGVPDFEISTLPLPLSHNLDRLTDAAHGRRIRRIYGSRHPSSRDLYFLEVLARERFGDAVARVEKADMVVFQGEGSIGPQESFGTVQLFALPFLASHLWKKTVLSMNMTLYASDRHDADLLAAIGNSLDLVAVREARSYAFARDIGLRDVLLCPDLAFARSEVGSSGALDVPGQAYFCVSGSAALDCFELEPFLDAVRQVAERHALTPVFVFSRAKDRRILKAAKRVLGSRRYVAVSSREAPRFEALLPLLRHSRFVLGGRYHTAISALAEGRPVILLPGNTFKSEGLGPMLGLDLPVLSPADLDGILAQADRWMTHPESSRAGIEAAIVEARARHALFREYLGQCFRTGFLPAERPMPLHPAVATFAPKGPHDALYAGANRSSPSDAALVARWKLHSLRASPDFAPEVRATLSRFE